MAVRSMRSSESARPFVLGRKTFAAISAIEGLKLSVAGIRRMKATGQLTPDQRRAEVIRAYAGRKGR
jgi:hypothetical protein